MHNFNYPCEGQHLIQMSIIQHPFHSFETTSSLSTNPQLKKEEECKVKADEKQYESSKKEDLLEMVYNSDYTQPLNIFDTKRKIIKKNQNKFDHDYRKNICSYITKKVMREFISQAYKEQVLGMCQSKGVSYDQIRNHYLARIEIITGLRHLYELLRQQQPICVFKAIFREFFEWFMKERYVRCLISDGRMMDKKAYIQYKNQVIADFFRKDSYVEGSDSLPLQT